MRERVTPCTDVVMNLILKSQGKTFPTSPRKTSTRHLKERAITTHIILKLLDLQLFRKLHRNSVWQVSEKSPVFSFFSCTQPLAYDFLRCWMYKRWKLHARNSRVSGAPSHKHNPSAGFVGWCKLLFPTSLCMSDPIKHRAARENKSPAWGCQQHHSSASFLKATPRTSSKEIWHQDPRSATWPLAQYFHKRALMFNANSTASLSQPSRQLPAFPFLLTEAFWFAHSRMFRFWNETYTTLTWTITLFWIVRIFCTV